MASRYERPLDGTVAPDKHFGGHSNPDYSGVYKHDPEKGATVSPAASPQSPPLTYSTGGGDAAAAKRKRKVAIVLGSAVLIGLALAIVLGVGLGVGLKSTNNSSKTDGGTGTPTGGNPTPGSPTSAPTTPTPARNGGTTSSGGSPTRPAATPTQRPARRPTASPQPPPPPALTAEEAAVCANPAAVNYGAGDLLVLDVDSSTGQSIGSASECCNACAANDKCNLFAFCNPGGSSTGCGPEKGCSLFVDGQYDGTAGTAPTCNSLGQWPKATCSLKQVTDFSALTQYEGKDAAGWLSGVFGAPAA